MAIHRRIPHATPGTAPICECATDGNICTRLAVFVTRCERLLCNECVFLINAVQIVHCGCPDADQDGHVRHWPSGAPCPYGEPPFENTRISSAVPTQFKGYPVPARHVLGFYHAWYSPEVAEAEGAVYYQHSVTGETIACTEVSSTRPLIWPTHQRWVGVVDTYLGADPKHHETMRRRFPITPPIWLA